MLSPCPLCYTFPMYTQPTTKERIAHSFLTLTETRPIDKITVREIAAACPVTTVTFYNHFHDKYDLIVWIYVQGAEQSMRTFSDSRNWRSTIQDGISYFVENRTFLLNALKHTSGHNSFLLQVARISETLLTAEVQKALGSGPVPQQLQYAIRMYSTGLVCLIFDWLMQDRPTSVEELAGIIDTCMPPPLRRFFP